jgi:hypothetical protein
MQKNEHLTSKEILTYNSFKEELADSELTREDAEAVFVDRTKMLETIKLSLSRHLAEAITIKIDHEKKALLEMVATDAQIRETHQKRNKVLDFTYFKKKPLNLRRI